MTVKKFKHQRFITLLVDSIVMQDVAISASHPLHARASVRASIYSSALILECVANSCIGDLRLTKSLADEIEFSKTIFKYDYFLTCIKGIRLDRSVSSIGIASALGELRNHIAHPKRLKGALGDDGHGDYGEMRALKIPRDVQRWEPIHSRTVLHAVLDFLVEFFISQCGLTKGQVGEIIIPNEEIDKPIEHFVLVVDPDVYKLIKKHAHPVLDLLNLDLDIDPDIGRAVL